MTRVTARAKATPARPADQADQDQAAEHPQTLSARPRGSVVTSRNAGALGPPDVPWRNLNGARHGAEQDVAAIKLPCKPSPLREAGPDDQRSRSRARTPRSSTRRPLRAWTRERVWLNMAQPDRFTALQTAIETVDGTPRCR